MELNTKRSTVTSANDSLLGSLVSSVGQLDETSGPINGLPNEMIKHIVAQLKQKPKSSHNYKYFYDVKLLVQLRLVSKRWRAIVEDFCREKKSLCVKSGHKSELDFDNSAPLVVNSIRSAHFFSVMPKLFPNIVKLDIGCLANFEDSEMENLALNISQLSSLKQLELGELEKVLPFLSQTLSQLEHILVFTSGNYIWTEEEFVQLVGHLGPDCVHVYLVLGIELNYNKLRQWHSLKADFFGNVTHFEFAIEEASDNDDHEQIVHFLSEHAPSLKLLRLSSVARSLVLTTSLLADLRTLTNLAELLLWNIRLELSDLEEAAAQNQLPQLSSLSICSLNWVEWSAESSVDRLMHILSSIFPKLVEMQLHFDMDSIPQTTPDEFEQYLDRFPNLRKQAIYIV